ncbi:MULTISPECIES: hypothetical protein [Lacticaseibacillus]|uniref:Uncharacterized protein n=1 Tax=Lacticaseibacillus hegangensis TaxID=2486010 RepID=A0ABW4CU87_9LACO|nr:MULTISPECIES: hypothetical protein [Lacticaseibacillus]
MYQLLLSYNDADAHRHTFTLSNLATAPDSAFAEELAAALQKLQIFGLNDTNYYEKFIEASVRYTQTDSLFTTLPEL